jgi:hypothetical protein
MAKYDRKQLMHRVQIALGELHLSSMTLADKKRLHYVEQGLLALDEEQALLKTGIEELLEAFLQGQPDLGDGVKAPLSAETSRLVDGLRKLVSDNHPRVAYPDPKLFGAPRTAREIPLRGPAPPKSTVKQLVNVQKNLGKIPKTNAKVK